jgi:outer membrane protein assembly factor BamD (BamD/ComL family)
MKRAILVLSVSALVLALVIGCQKGPKAEDIFTEAKQLQENAQYAEAVAKYQQLVDRYPKNRFAPQAQFMIGFIYANELDEYDKAKVAYEAFLANYADVSDSGMVASAKWELDNLGKDINEIEDLGIVEEGQSAEKSGETQ